MARGFERLGWHWWPSDSAIITRDYDGRRACNNCGPCDLGCPIGAKASTDVTYWPKALALGAAARRRARGCARSPWGRMAAPTAWSTTTARGARRAAGRARRAGRNGVGTPRLLLNSRSARFPDGLANRSGLVGRNLMFHPYAMVRGVFDAPLGGHRGPIGCSIISQEFYETDLLARLRARLLVPGGARPDRHRHGHRRLSGHRVPWGREHRRRTTRASTAPSPSPSSARTCRRRTTGSTSTRARPTATAFRRRASPTRSARTAGACSTTASARAREALEAAGARAVDIKPLLRAGGLAPDGHGAHGDRPGDARWSTPRGAATTCRISTSSTAASW